MKTQGDNKPVPVSRSAAARMAIVALAALAAILVATAASCASFAPGGEFFPAAGVDRIRRIDIGSDALPAELDGYRIAFVSDIHFGNRFPRARLDALFSAINAEKADCIVIGGDDTLGTREIAEFASAARELEARDGVYAILGNHDFYNGRAETIRSLRDAGIPVLDETLVRLPRGIALAGAGDFRDRFPLMKRLAETVHPGEFTVLATHNPYLAENADLSGFDLVLSGHTHGGQIAFFGYAPALGKGQAYRTGTVRRDGVPVVVSNGAGFGGEGLMRFRLGAPSDFILITLRRTSPR